MTYGEVKQMMSGLPEGWKNNPLSEVSIVTMGQSPESRTYNDKSHGLPFFQEKAEFGKLYPSVRKWCSEPTKIADAGDILLSVRAPVGPTNLAPDKCCIGRGLAAIRAKKTIEQNYLLHYLRCIEPWLNQQGTGTTFAAISGDFIRALSIPLPPLIEQKRIADKLDALLARVDACRERLDRVPVILKRFRQAVLAAATSGGLTEEWRENHPSPGAPRHPLPKGEGTVLPTDVPPLHEREGRGEGEGLPEGWRSVSLNKICMSITDGDHQAPPQAEIGIPFITISAINDGKLRLNKATRFVPSSYYQVLKSSRKPEIGDILFSVTGSIAIPALVDVAEAFTFQRHIAILKPNVSEILSNFLLYALGADSIKSQALDVATGTAQLTVPLSGLRSFKIVLPPLPEQHEIVRRVETLFAFADRLEARYNAARKQVDQLTPSLLAKAFRGELVSHEESQNLTTPGPLLNYRRGSL